jgi:hypothetical protein
MKTTTNDVGGGFSVEFSVQPPQDGVGMVLCEWLPTMPTKAELERVDMAKLQAVTLAFVAGLREMESGATQ